MNIVQLKKESLEDLKGKWVYVSLVALFFIALTIFLSYIFRYQNLYYYLVKVLILSGLDLGLCYFFMNIKKDKFKVSDLFKKYNLLPKAIVISLVFNIINFLSYFHNIYLGPLQIVGLDILYFVVFIALVFVTIRLTLSNFILIENPKENIFKIFKRSNDMMRGNTSKYIWMYISFIPWIIVSIFTFGVAALYVFPYIQMTQLNFYYKLKEGYNEKDNKKE
jgi:uncharacterized membrane protein